MTLAHLHIEKKIEKIRKLFDGISADEKMQQLLSLGRSLPPYPNELIDPSNIVAGCQSTLYLSSRLKDGLIFFDAQSDALISAGLVALLIFVYNGETPQTILNTPPSFLSDLDIIHSLTPTRANGLAHIHQRMKKDALNYLLQSLKSIASNS